MSQVYGAARVSTEQQAFDKALNDQAYRLIKAGAKEVFCDIDSRESESRENLDKLLSLVEQGLVSKILVIRLDRLTASSSLLERIIRLCKTYNVELVALDENIDPLSRSGRLSTAIQVAVACHEVSLTRERVLNNKKLRKEQGKVIGVLPWGYRNSLSGYPELNTAPFLCTLSNKKTWTADELARYFVAQFFKNDLKVATTVRSINSEFGLQKFYTKPTKPSLIFTADSLPDYKRNKNIKSGCIGFSIGGLKHWLTNPILRGHTAYNKKDRGTKEQPKYDILTPDKWVIVPDTHPEHRIVSEEQWQIIEERFFSQRKEGVKGTRKPLSGLVRCQCGYSCTIESSTKRTSGVFRYFVCRMKRLDGCNLNHRPKYETIEQFVINQLKLKAELLSEAANDVSEIKEEPEEIRQLKKQLALTQASLAVYKSEAFLTAEKELLTEIKKLELEETYKYNRNERLIELYKVGFENQGYWDSLSDGEKEIIFHGVIDYIEVLSRNDFVVYWKHPE